jgi:hypothetical protein
MKYSLRLLLLSLAVLLPLAGCDKASPVAPEGTTLTLSASPAEISSANGTSIITVVARKANGQPVTPGTEVRFSTTLGTIDPVVETDRSGVAEATLRGDGRLGTAHVTASTGAVRTDPMDVIIGTPARNISLQATPTTLPSTGGRVTLLALVRDARGLPLANQGVNFTTQLGTLASRGGLVQTDANGQARDTLTLNEQDLGNNQSSVAVSANVAGGDGALVSDDFSIQIQTDRPIAAFTYERGTTNLDVLFQNDSTGGGGDLTFSWNFGDGASGTGPSIHHTYAAADTYTVILTVTSTSSGLSDTATARVTVPVTARGTGN